MIEQLEVRHEQAGPLAIREINTPGELQSSRTDWLELWKRSSRATPFQSPDWLIPWWKYFANGRLCVLELRNNSRLVGLAPFFVTDASDENSLRLLGTGNTDYLDILVDDGVSQEAAAAIFEGAREFDFLRGREDYKYRWGAADQPLYRKRLEPKE